MAIYRLTPRQPMHRWSVTTAVLLALSGAACSGADSADPLIATECTELIRIAAAADNVFEVGTSVDDLGSVLYLQDHASTHEASLDAYAGRVPDTVREDIETLQTLYAGYADSVERQGLTSGKTPTYSQVERVKDATSIEENVVDSSSRRVSAWARTNCG